MKLVIEGTETETQNFLKSNFPAAIKTIHDVIVIESILNIQNNRTILQ